MQSDNGSEFEKYFNKYLEKKGITHYYNYPRHPQSNGHIERFNRTIQEQYLEWDGLEDIEKINEGLMNYLLWYNIERPHQGLGGKSPIEVIIDEIKKDPKKSNMYRDYTTYCLTLNKFIKFIKTF